MGEASKVFSFCLKPGGFFYKPLPTITPALLPVDHLVDTITAERGIYSVIRSAYLSTHLVTISGGFNALALLVAAAAGGLTPPFFSLFLFIFFRQGGRGDRPRFSVRFVSAR